MIESKLLDMFGRKCPNYHLVAEKFAKQTYSLCTCSKCQHCIAGKSYGGKPQKSCKRLMDELIEIGAPIGHSLVAENGTCDAAQFITEDYSKFVLEQNKTDAFDCHEVTKTGDAITQRTCKDCGFYDPMDCACNHRDEKHNKDEPACDEFVYECEAADIEGMEITNK